MVATGVAYEASRVSKTRGKLPHASELFCTRAATLITTRRNMQGKSIVEVAPFLRTIVPTGGSIVRRYIQVVLLPALVVLQATTAAQSTVVLDGFETAIVTTVGYDFAPLLSGDTLAFSTSRHTGPDMYYVDLATMTINHIVVGHNYVGILAVSGSRVLYRDNTTSDLMLFDTATSITTNITRPIKDALGQDFSVYGGDLDGNLVGWVDSRAPAGHPMVHAMDLITLEERPIGDGDRVAIDGSNIIVSAFGFDLYSYDWNARQTTWITNDRGTCNEYEPRADAGTVVYYVWCGVGPDWAPDIAAYDFETGTTRRLELPGQQFDPQISGDNVTFRNASSGKSQIQLWHLPSGQLFPVTTTDSNHYTHDIDGNRVVYSDDRSGDTNIYMFTFTITPTDTTPPVISVTPACPATLMLGSSFSVGVMVTDEASGVAWQSVPNGTRSLDTTTVGSHSLSIEATDYAGNSATSNCSYTVIYDFAGAGGFSPPVHDQPSVNTVNAGRVVVLKFRLPDGYGGYISALEAVTSIAFGEVSDFAAAPGITSDADAAGATALRYDASAQQFVFTWQTDREMAGRSYMLVLQLDDGMEYYANFAFR